MLAIRRGIGPQVPLATGPQAGRTPGVITTGSLTDPQIVFLIDLSALLPISAISLRLVLLFKD